MTRYTRKMKCKKKNKKTIINKTKKEIQGQGIRKQNTA
jgi:hypothetical protein